MAEKKKREEPHPADSYPCPVCGGRDFTWGKMRIYGTRDAAYFRADGIKFLAPGKQMRVRECSNCGNVLMFTAR